MQLPDRLNGCILVRFASLFLSFVPGSALKFPPEGVSLRWYKNIFVGGACMGTFRAAIVISLLGNLLALLLGVPAAYALSRYRFRGRDMLNAVFLSPVLIPGIVLGFTLLRYLIVVYN
ncbi:hypothetical protein AMQ83_20870, partial [Paenibacillus riograndensis]